MVHYMLSQYKETNSISNSSEIFNAICSLHNNIIDLKIFEIEYIKSSNTVFQIITLYPCDPEPVISKILDNMVLEDICNLIIDDIRFKPSNPDTKIEILDGVRDYIFDLLSLNPEFYQDKKHLTSVIIMNKMKNIKYYIYHTWQKQFIKHEAPYGSKIINVSGGKLLQLNNNDKKFKIKNVYSYSQIIKYLVKLLLFDGLKLAKLYLNGPRISAFIYILKGFVDYKFFKNLSCSFYLKNNNPIL